MRGATSFLALFNTPRTLSPNTDNEDRLGGSDDSDEELLSTEGFKGGFLARLGSLMPVGFGVFPPGLFSAASLVSIGDDVHTGTKDYLTDSTCTDFLDILPVPFVNKFSANFITFINKLAQAVIDLNHEDDPDFHYALQPQGFHIADLSSSLKTSPPWFREP
jgi:hypothetical protein